jgi:hypothetical protein
MDNVLFVLPGRHRPATPRTSPQRRHLFVAVFFRMRFGRFGRMLRGLFMMPTGGMRMMRGFLVIPGLMVFGGFFVMPRGVLMLFRRLIVMLGCFGRHGKSP